MLIKRTENGQTTIVLHKQLEHHLSTGLYKKYYAFNGRVIALRDGLNLLNPVTFFVADHLGSISTTIWAGGSKRSDLRYDPWGKARWSQTNYTIPTGHRYTSQRWEDKLGLYDYNARYYDPTTARFLSWHSRENGNTLIPDPSNPQQFNRFAYILNNPLRFTDPTGHISCTNSNLPGDDQQACHSTTPLSKGENSIVTFSPLEKIPSGWRTVRVNYRNLFGSHATNSAPNGTVYIYYQQSVASTEGLPPFEIVARVLLGENTRGLLFDDSRFAEEVEEHWPQDQVAQLILFFATQ